MDSLHRFGWEIWSHHHGTLTPILELVNYIRPQKPPVDTSSAWNSPSRGGDKSNIYAHIRLDNFLVRLSEHKTCDQDMNKRLHFNQG
jgi:hypothetical protein